MNKQKFSQLFANSVELAIQKAEKRLGFKLPRSYQIQLYGAGSSGLLLEPACALDRLYLSEDKFYRIIDVAVVKVSKQSVTVFVRASGHKPTPFAQTWNQPLGSGPFKQINAMKIEVEWSALKKSERERMQFALAA